MFISPAYAQGAGGVADLNMLIPFALIFVVFYFLLIRPQQKKQKAHREMLGALRRGDRIVTAGGLIGQITRVVSDTELIVEIAENTRVRVARSLVSDVMAKTEPADATDDEDEEEDDDEEPTTGGKKNSRRRKARQDV